MPKKVAVKLVGDWKKGKFILNNMKKNVDINLTQVMKKNAHGLQRALRAKVRDGDSTWPALRRVTKERKNSSKKLRRTDEFLNAIIVRRIPKGHRYTVGIPKGAVNSKGESLVKIAETHEYGAVVVPKKASVLAIPISLLAEDMSEAYGGVKSIPGLFRPKGTKILALKIAGGLVPLFMLREIVFIPPRPFWARTLRRQKPIMRKRIEKAIGAALRGKIRIT